MKNKKVLGWILSHSKVFLLPLLTLTGFSAVLSFLSLWMTLISKQLVDAATTGFSERFFQRLFFLFLLFLGQLVLQAFLSRLTVWTSGKLEISFKSLVYSALLRKDYMSLSGYHTGELLNRLTSDVSVVTNGVVNILPTIVSFGTRLVGALIIMYSFDPLFAGVYLVFGPIFMFLARIYSNKMKALHKSCQQSDGETKAFMQETLQNVLVVKAFGKEKAISQEGLGLQKKNFSLKLKRNTISILANILMNVAFTFGYYFAIGWGAYQLMRQIISFGTFTGMIQLVGQIQMPFKNLSDVVPQYYSAIASGERLMELVGLKEEKVEPSTYSGKELYDKLDKIIFSKVSFSYGDVPVLSDFSYEIKKGEFLAISGISGIGKSTMLKLLLGVIVPSSGEIYLTLSSGKKVPLDHNLRQLFAYVPQGNMILSGTLRENICFFSDKVSEEDLMEAVKAAQLEDLVETLPRGLETPLGEKGTGLSEGQIQRLAIARALLSDAPILLLDEATSALDEETERNFLASIREKHNKTCLIVSHKQAALELCDQIIKF